MNSNGSLCGLSDISNNPILNAFYFFDSNSRGVNVFLEENGTSTLLTFSSTADATVFRTFSVGGSCDVLVVKVSINEIGKKSYSV